MKHFLLVSCIFLLAFGLRANNIQVTNVQVPGSLGQSSANPDSLELDITFDLAWDNSWRVDDGPANYDGAYVFVYYRIDGSPWRILGNNPDRQPASPTGFTRTDSGPGGSMIYRSSEGMGNVSLQTVAINGIVNGAFVTSANDIEVRVFAIEMVKVPEGRFYLGSPTGTEIGAFFDARDSRPQTGKTWVVDSEARIDFVRRFSDGQFNLNTGPETGDLSNRNIDATFPKGFSAFWMMKYEVTEGQYVDFFNTLTDSQQDLMDVTGALGKDSDEVVDGNTISWEGLGTEMTTQSPDRAINYVNQNMVLSYLAWAGLRPPTELEYEKACRGTLLPVAGEFAWGTTTIDSNEYTLSNQGLEDELVTNPSSTAGNALYLATSDTLNRSPFRAGIFPASASLATRVLTGGSALGIMELSGNLSEATISATGGAAGFRQADGNFELDFNGLISSSNTGWPRNTNNPGGLFWALRGGDFTTLKDRLVMYDRTKGEVNLVASPNVGFRGVTIRE